MDNYDEKLNYSFEPAAPAPAEPAQPLQQAKEEIRRSGRHTGLKIAALLTVVAIVAAAGGYALKQAIAALGEKNLAGQQTSVDAIFNCMTTVILRPDAFDAPDSQAQTEAFIAWCKQSPHDADAPVLAPGEWEAANREARLAQGIPLDAGSWQAICAAARDVGLSESHFDRCRPLA